MVELGGRGPGQDPGGEYGQTEAGQDMVGQGGQRTGWSPVGQVLPAPGYSRPLLGVEAEPGLWSQHGRCCLGGK